jgi:plastocyanin
MTPTTNPNHIVFVGQGGTQFVDSISGTSITTINAGQTVEWQWAPGIGPHSTTSGTCDVNICTPVAGWNSGPIGPLPGPTSYPHTFQTNGVFTYYCLVHGVMMQGVVNVQ